MINFKKKDLEELKQKMLIKQLFTGEIWLKH
jgi:hypothetical protein